MKNNEEDSDQERERRRIRRSYLKQAEKKEDQDDEDSFKTPVRVFKGRTLARTPPLGPPAFEPLDIPPLPATPHSTMAGGDGSGTQTTGAGGATGGTANAVTKSDLNKVVKTMTDSFAGLFAPAGTAAAAAAAAAAGRTGAPAGPLAGLITGAGTGTGTGTGASASAAPAAAPSNTRKITAFTDADDPVEWQIWRAKFEMIAGIAGWDDLRQRQELFANMGGAAARAVSDIQVGGSRTYNAVVTQYEARFVTPAASELSRGEFHVARQMTDESILEWHARCRSLYLRAYPGSSPSGAGNDGIQLRERFARGLESNVIREYVWDQRPANYSEMLTSAQNKLATITMMAAAKDEAKGANKEEEDETVHAIRRPRAKSAGRFSSAGMQCFLCDEKNHVVRSCPLLDKAKASLAAEDDTASGARWKKRKNKGKEEKKAWKKGIHHLIAGNEDVEDDSSTEEEESSSEEEN